MLDLASGRLLADTKDSQIVFMDEDRVKAASLITCVPRSDWKRRQDWESFHVREQRSDARRRERQTKDS